MPCKSALNKGICLFVFIRDALVFWRSVRFIKNFFVYFFFSGVSSQIDDVRFMNVSELFDDVPQRWRFGKPGGANTKEIKVLEEVDVEEMR